MSVTYDTIENFICLGWHTVPLSGEIKRLDNGKKTIPVFEKEWKNKYTEHKNTRATLLGGVLTGKVSGIVAIDCDNAATYAMFRDLDREYSFLFESVGKGGGTIIYSLPEDLKLPPTFSLVTVGDAKDLDVKLDFFSDDGFVYLPSKNNTSKRAWTRIHMGMPVLKVVPSSVLMLLNVLYEHSERLKYNRNAEHDSLVMPNKLSLAPLVNIFVSKKAFTSNLFRILTPNRFRLLDEYKEKGFLHPKNVPDGRGSEYLSCVSAILGADSSINEELYTDAILLINTLWENPMRSEQLNTTIIEPMLDSKASIDGKPIWTYNSSWESASYVIETKRNETVEAFYDDCTDMYYIVNQVAGRVNVYTSAANYNAALDVLSHVQLKKQVVIRRTPLVTAVTRPELPFGINTTETIDGPIKSFNLFRQSKALNIINNPEQWESRYKFPSHTLDFFSSLVPDESTRDYLLSFLKVKFTTFSYSPVVLYLLGISGSGKDTFVELISTIMGKDNEYIAKPVAKVFIEKHNGWLRNIFFAQLDEYGDQLLTVQNKQEATGRIKMYTGSPKITMRQMHNDGKLMSHAITFIMTANTNPLTLDANDRRILFIDTPNVLKNEQWVLNAGGITAARNAMWEELYDFCYYLATEVRSLTMDDYTTPPENQGKLSLIASSLPIADRIVFCLINGMIDELKDIISIAGCDPFLYTEPHGILESELYRMYVGYDPDYSSKKLLSLALKKYGVIKSPAKNKDGISTQFCNIVIPHQLRGIMDRKDKAPVRTHDLMQSAPYTPELD